MNKYLVYVETIVLRCFEVEAESHKEAAQNFAEGKGKFMSEELSFGSEFDGGEIVDVIKEEY